MAKKIVLVFAPENFRDEELFNTKQELESQGIEVKTASVSLNEAIGMLGGKAKAELLLDQINVEEFDGIAFIGGSGASVYFDNKTALQLAKEFFNKQKVVGAICIAPSILANAGILKGKKATSYSTEKENLENKGAIFTGSMNQVDGKIVTASGPTAARQFGKDLASKL